MNLSHLASLRDKKFGFGHEVNTEAIFPMFVYGIDCFGGHFLVRADTFCLAMTCDAETLFPIYHLQFTIYRWLT